MIFEKDWDKFLEQMSKIGSIYGEVKPKEILRFYFDALKNFDAAIVLKSINYHIRTCKFYPKPAELIEFCKEEKAKIKRSEKIEIPQLQSVNDDPMVCIANSMTCMLLVNKVYKTSDKFVLEFIESMGGLKGIRELIKEFDYEILLSDYDSLDSYHSASSKQFFSARSIILKALVEHSKGGHHILEMIDESENIRQIFGGK